MAHHYIPQYYLSRFANSAGTICVYEKGSQRVFCAGTRRVASETGYYSDETEQYLANAVEGPANRVIKRIRERQTVSTRDKVDLSKYMVVMLKRVPRGKERTEAKSPEVLGGLLKNLDNELTNLLNQYPDREQIEERRKEAKQLRERIETDPDFKSDLVRDAWLKTLPPDMTPKTLKALSLMTWRFLTFDKGPAFLTSDNPVFFFTKIGIGNERSEVTFPISRNVVLWATWRRESEEGYYRARKSQIHQINRRTVSIATRYVFHSDEADWVIRLVNRKRHNIRRLTS